MTSPLATELAPAVAAFAEANGGYWNGEHPKALCADWKREVSEGETRMGYWEWAFRVTGEGA